MNAVWALDFMRDALQRPRLLIDEANRGALGIDIAVSIPAARVITFLTTCMADPLRFAATMGQNSRARGFTDWCKAQDIELRFYLTGKLCGSMWRAGRAGVPKPCVVYAGDHGAAGHRGRRAALGQRVMRPTR